MRSKMDDGWLQDCSRWMSSSVGQAFKKFGLRAVCADNLREVAALLEDVPAEECELLGRPVGRPQRRQLNVDDPPVGCRRRGPRPMALNPPAAVGDSSVHAREFWQPAVGVQPEGRSLSTCDCSQSRFLWQPAALATGWRLGAFRLAFALRLSVRWVG